MLNFDIMVKQLIAMPNCDRFFNLLPEMQAEDIDNVITACSPSKLSYYKYITSIHLAENTSLTNELLEINKEHASYLYLNEDQKWKIIKKNIFNIRIIAKQANDDMYNYVVARGYPLNSLFYYISDDLVESAIKFSVDNAREISKQLNYELEKMIVDENIKNFFNIQEPSFKIIKYVAEKDTENVLMNVDKIYRLQDSFFKLYLYKNKEVYKNYDSPIFINHQELASPLFFSGTTRSSYYADSIST